MLLKRQAIIKNNTTINFALADQALVSGVNFLTGLFIARYLGIEEFGIFSLLWMVAIFSNSLQMALIISPMMSLCGKKNGRERVSFLENLLIQQIVLLVITFMVLFGSIKAFAALKGEASSFSEFALPLALAGCFYQAQDYIRRYLFCLNKFKYAFVNDFISYGGQISGLLLFASAQTLTITTTLNIISLSSFIAVLFGVAHLSRPSLNIKLLLKEVKSNWGFSKWLLLSTITQWASGNTAFIMAGVILGPTAVGIMKSAQNIIGISHIIFQALENFVPATASHALASKGISGLRRYISKVCRIGGLFTFLLTVLISFFSYELMTSVYGKDYGSHSDIIYWYIPIYVLMYIALILQAGIRALEQPRAIFKSRLLSAIAMIVVIWPLTINYEINGAMLSFLISIAIFTIALYLNYIFYIRNNNE